MKINVIYVDSEQKLRESKQRWETYTNTWMEDKLTRKIIDRKQFFVYKLTIIHKYINWRVSNAII